ncbi:MAG: HNH endonuclease [Actinomycetota bacterium]|nr:HNH endonuclease [Actinomycetota bacterium]
MAIFIGNTDPRWYRFLSQRNETVEVNFWRPSGRPKTFRAIAPGEFFFFRLGRPIRKIVGFGTFTYYSVYPLLTAWETFGQANGCGTINDLISLIAEHREEAPDTRAALAWNIGCTILTDVHYYPESEWLDFYMPPGPVAGKSLDERSEEGTRVWRHMEAYFEKQHRVAEVVPLGQKPFSLVEGAGVYRTVPVKERRGQGGFRVMVLDAYHRRCCVTGERTLPVIEAAHIQTYISPQSNHVQNGLAFREDVHTLFDEGYVAVDEGHRFVVSPRLREDFENGREYYKFHGASILLPDHPQMAPSKDAIRWHLEYRFMG